jgi:two-component system cell cycle response regulator
MEKSPEQIKILVADDSAVYRKLIETTLAPAGYSLLFARDGQEAFALIARHRPEIVLTDWEMPDLTGIELCARIRQNEASYAYIILITSNKRKGQIVQGLEAGADDYLTKPFHSGELLARIAVGRRFVELNQQLRAKNRLLEELALTDPLTGLPNRRAIEEWGRRELKGAARHAFPFWIAIVDLDHFKSVNDNWGHAAGDEVLKKFAELLRANTRASDICGRIGGEEFLVAVTHLKREGVLIAIDRIRHAFEDTNFSFEGRALRVTASFGISGFSGNQAPELSHLLRDADAALYLAKRSGRNRHEFASDSPE